MDKGSALLSMDEQEEAFIDTSTSNGNSPGRMLFRMRREMLPRMTHFTDDAVSELELPSDTAYMRQRVASAACPCKSHVV